MGVGCEWLNRVVRVQSVTWAGVLISPSPLIPLLSRERGRMVGLFFCPSTAPPLWIADQVRNDGTTALWILP